MIGKVLGGMDVLSDSGSSKVESHGQNTLPTIVVPLTKAGTHRRIDQTQCSCIVDDLKATLVGCGCKVNNITYRV